MKQRREEIIAAILAKDKKQLRELSGKLRPVVIYNRRVSSDIYYNRETGQALTKEQLSKSGFNIVILLPDNDRDIIPLANREEDVVL